MEEELQSVRAKLKRLPAYDRNAQPEEFQSRELKAAPLRARRDAIKKALEKISRRKQGRYHPQTRTDTAAGSPTFMPQTP